MLIIFSIKHSLKIILEYKLFYIIKDPLSKFEYKLEKSVHDFKDLFEELFIKGLPSFWDGKGKLHE